MGTTQVYFGTAVESNLFGIQNFNNPGGPGTTVLQGVNPYLKPEGTDGNLVGLTAAIAGDGDGNVDLDAPPYGLQNPLPNRLLLQLGDQVWGPRTYGGGFLPQYNKVPAGAMITSVTFVGNLDASLADTWRLIMKISGGEHYINKFADTGFSEAIPLNPATGLPWTRAQLFSTEWGYDIQTSTLAGTVANSHYWWPYRSTLGTNIWYTWFICSEMYLLVDYSDNQSVSITGSGGFADSGGIPGGGFDLSGFHLAISGGLTGGGDGPMSAPTTGCPPDLPMGADSGGGAGCLPDLPSGSDSSGGSGCGVVL